MVLSYSIANLTNEYSITPTVGTSSSSVPSLMKTEIIIAIIYIYEPAEMHGTHISQFDADWLQWKVPRLPVIFTFNADPSPNSLFFIFTMTKTFTEPSPNCLSITLTLFSHDIHTAEARRGHRVVPSRRNLILTSSLTWNLKGLTRASQRFVWLRWSVQWS